MHLSDNTRFIALTLGAFLLVLGSAVLILSLVERIFFAPTWPRMFVSAAPVTILLGAALLFASRRKDHGIDEL